MVQLRVSLSLGLLNLQQRQFYEVVKWEVASGSILLVLIVSSAERMWIKVHVAIYIG